MFYNPCEANADASASRFSWRLQRLPPKRPKEEDDDPDPNMPQPPPIEESAFVAFGALEGTSVDVHVAGEYELAVLHDESLVRGKPTRLKVERARPPPTCIKTVRPHVHALDVPTCTRPTAGGAGRPIPRALHAPRLGAAPRVRRGHATSRP